MPIYNVSSYLDSSLECAKRQTLQDVEIICVNDGSTDNSLEIIKKWAEGDERFVIIDKKNGGYGVAMNTGIDRASGDYIAIFEPDDIIPLNMYEDLYKLASANDLDFVKGDFYMFTVGKTGNVAMRNIPIDKHRKYYDRILDPAMMPELTTLNQMTWTGIYKRAFLNDNGIRYHETPGASFQDIGFFWKTTSHARRAMFVNKPYYRYRVDNPNQSVKDRTKVFNRDKEYDYIKDFLMEEPALWERFKGYYYASRFRRSLINLRRINSAFAEEYIGTMMGYYPGLMESGDFDPALLAPKERKALNVMLSSYDEFYEEYHVAGSIKERNLRTDIWERLKEEKKKSAVLEEEVKRLKDSIQRIKGSRSYRLSRKLGKIIHR